MDGDPDDAGGTYRHRQIGWVMLGAMVGVVVLFVALRGTPREGRLFSALISVLALAVLSMFSTLTVIGDDAGLSLRFGPGLIRVHFRWDEIAACRRVRNSWISGFGLRYGGSGWLYNVSGLDAVELRMRNGDVNRVGTDDPDGLEQFVRSHITIV